MISVCCYVVRQSVNFITLDCIPSKGFGPSSNTCVLDFISSKSLFNNIIKYWLLISMFELPVEKGPDNKHIIPRYGGGINLRQSSHMMQ